ncbi:MAG: class I tRNA ligase family protein, partial [Deltaproteobacteria bacterium]|nr:class I tRNA ligase family protein [Deltaproteobacteria bacterium]
ELSRRLVKAGFAYEKLRSVYFNIGRFDEYGRLSGVDVDKIRLGATVDLDSYEKDDPRDFTLLKRSTLGELKRGVCHKTEWGNVRPGWHIECAAMAMSLLGEQADIHVGGVDLVFPHHENEIAICQAATGKRPANYWIHSGLVMVDRRKMSRSSDNAVFVDDVLKQGYTGRQLRFYLLSQHYRQPFHFSYDALDASCTALKRLDDCVANLQQLDANGGAKAHPDVGRHVAEFEAQFREALFDDLNVSAANAALFHLIRCVNRRLAKGQVGRSDAEAVIAALSAADEVFGILGEPSADDPLAANDKLAALVADREAARAARDFQRADELRQAIEAEGYVLEDTAQGPRVRPTG